MEFSRKRVRLRRSNDRTTEVINNQGALWFAE